MVVRTPACISGFLGTIDFEPSGILELSINSTINILTGGKIVSHGSSSEIIRIGGVTKFNGNNDGTMNGPAYASSQTGSSPSGFSPGLLAIKLYYFQARLVNGRTSLSWSASSDESGDQFFVQRSSDGFNWTDLQTIPASVLHEPVNYTYTDHLTLRGTSFYRIVLSNAGGKENYSRVIHIVTDLIHLKIFPNPVSTEARLSWGNTKPAGTVYLELMNAANISVLKKLIPPGDNFYILDIKALPAGIYRVRITDQASFNESTLLVVSK